MDYRRMIADGFAGEVRTAVERAIRGFVQLTAEEENFSNLELLEIVQEGIADAKGLLGSDTPDAECLDCMLSAVENTVRHMARGALLCGASMDGVRQAVSEALDMVEKDIEEARKRKAKLLANALNNRIAKISRLN